MKKKSVIALILACVMLLGIPLAGCSNSVSSGETSAPASSPDKPAETTTQSAVSAPSTSAAPPAAADEKFSMVYLSYAMGIGWCVQVADAFKELGEKYNIDVEIADGNFNAETQLNQLDQYLSKGVDAVACMLVDEGMAEVMVERCNEAGVVLIGETTQFFGDDGNLLIPCDYVDGHALGMKQAQWTVDNYKRLGFDLSDLSKVGYIYITDTTFTEMQPRVDGAYEVWMKAFPDFPQDQMYCADRSADSGSNMEAGYNQTAAILSAHPEMEQWIVLSFQEDYASGACRAIEDLNLVEKSLLVSAGGENVIPEWDNGMTKPWYAACYFTGMDSATIAMDALIKIIRQGVALEDVYPNKYPGQKYGYATFSGEMIAFDNYKTLIKE